MKTIKSIHTLAIDIGGSSIKMMVLDRNGVPLTPYIQAPTPNPATVNAVCDTLGRMIGGLPVSFDRIAAGFPGVVEEGVVLTAPNMHVSWIGVAFQQRLQILFGHPVRVANDADIQGYGDVVGKGVELVITLGTGLGSALFINGTLVPNLELWNHPFQGNQTYEDLLGQKALDEKGIDAWRKHLKEALVIWKQTFNYKRLYLGGGNAKKINLILPPEVIIADNINGVLGGMKLWERKS